MNHLKISNSSLTINISDGRINGDNVIESKRLLKDLKNFYEDEESRSAMLQDELIYEVQAILPVDQDTEGGLFFGRTVIQPGKVGNEYFMTKGHFHGKPDRGEYYWCLQGEGMLILMDRKRKTWAERMTRGSLHYIPGYTAHRTANTSENPLIFEACWPSDAGYDYQEIQKNGFSARLKEVNGKPLLESAKD